MLLLTVESAQKIISIHHVFILSSSLSPTFYYLHKEAMFWLHSLVCLSFAKTPKNKQILLNVLGAKGLSKERGDYIWIIFWIQ